MPKDKMKKLISRKCDGCTKCCEGWLFGMAHEKRFWPGRPCHYMAKSSCSIYADRPEDPCKIFTCEWLINDDVPEWVKPNEINAIITNNTKNGISYWRVSEAGAPLSVSFLSWLFSHCLGNNINFVYNIGSGHYKFGSQEFLDLPEL